jgi:hypothetical protein
LARAIVRGVSGGDARLRIDFRKLARRDGTTIDVQAEASPLEVVGPPPPPSSTAPASSPTAATPTPATPTAIPTRPTSATPSATEEATPSPPVWHIRLPFLVRNA